MDWNLPHYHFFYHDSRNSRLVHSHSSDWTVWLSCCAQNSPCQHNHMKARTRCNFGNHWPMEIKWNILGKIQAACYVFHFWASSIKCIWLKVKLEMIFPNCICYIIDRSGKLCNLWTYNGLPILTRHMTFLIEVSTNDFYCLCFIQINQNEYC